MSNWQQFKNFINTKEIGYIFTRKELRKAFSTWRGSQIDSNRKLLTYAKCLVYLGRGKYRLDQYAEKDLTMELAYLTGNNLKYLQYLYERKLRSVKKEIKHINK